MPNGKALKEKGDFGLRVVTKKVLDVFKNVVPI